MKVNEKRQVIEVLLCAGSSGAPLLFRAAIELDVDNRAVYSAAFGRELDELYRKVDEESEDIYGSRCLEAAYRLIESSPTLRKEWFRR